MPMPNRQIVGGEPYRYGYQGEFAETDPETGKPAFQLRLYDPRLGRWLTTDPMGQYHSPYMAMDNRPNMSVDPTGGCTGPDCDKSKVFSNDAGGNAWSYIDGSWNLLSAITLQPVELTLQTSDHARKMSNPIVKAVHRAQNNFLRNETTVAIAAAVTLPYTLPALLSEALLIYGGRHLIAKTITSSFVANSARQGVLNFTASAGSQFLTNGYDIGRVDFLDATVSGLTSGMGSTLFQSSFNWSYTDGMVTNNTNQFISSLTGKILVKGIHSKIKIPIDTYFGDAPLISVGNMFTNLLTKSAYKTVQKNF
jgi:RHS repeat-associated protein